MKQPDEQVCLDVRIRKAMLVGLWLLIIGGAVVLFSYLRPAIRFALDVISPFAVAVIVAYVFNPVVLFFQRRFGMGRLKGVVVTYAIILVLAASIVAILLPVLYIQLRAGITAAGQELPAIARSTVTYLDKHFPSEEWTRVRDAFKDNSVDWQVLTDKAGPVVQTMVRSTKDAAGYFTRFVGSTIAFSVGLIGFIAFVVIITFYFLLDYFKMGNIVRVLVPERKQARVFEVWRKVDHALGGFLRGQFIVCIIVGSLYSIGLMLIGMKPYAILIGFGAGFGNLIPYFGPIAGGVPSILWVIFGDHYGTFYSKLIGIGLVMLLSLTIQTIDGFFLQPRIVGKSAEIHPLLVILALIIGSQFGIGGLILAVPTAIVARVLLKTLWWDPLAARKLPKQSSEDSPDEDSEA